MAEARIGTAGWSIPAARAEDFPNEGTALERYSARFDSAEIDTCFHRSHRPATYERWAAAVPPEFRFSAKLPQTITHQQRLVEAGALVDSFLEETEPLSDKLAIILVQLPPSLAVDVGVAARFFLDLRTKTGARIACEPRHASWFDDAADDLLASCKVARVAADPAKVPQAALPGGWRGLSYYRLHGSPVPYRSSYEPERLASYAKSIADDLTAGREVWCIFDNTASSAAAGNALDLIDRLGRP